MFKSFQKKRHSSAMWMWCATLPISIQCAIFDILRLQCSSKCNNQVFRINMLQPSASSLSI